MLHSFSFFQVEASSQTSLSPKLSANGATTYQPGAKRSVAPGEICPQRLRAEGPVHLNSADTDWKRDKSGYKKCFGLSALIFFSTPTWGVASLCPRLICSRAFGPLLYVKNYAALGILPVSVMKIYLTGGMITVSLRQLSRTSLEQGLGFNCLS